MSRFDGKYRSRIHTAPVKSVVISIMPGLRKEFSKEMGRPVWIYGELKLETLQEVVDTFFPSFPALIPMATRGAIERRRQFAEKAAADLEMENEKVKLTNQYWNCECENDYIHPRSEEICGSCGTKREDGPDSRVSEVRAFGYTLEEESEPATTEA